MTDRELTRFTAEAMQVENTYPWNPLADDVQAMGLVKRFDMGISPARFGEGQRSVVLYTADDVYCGMDADLNRAIVECVAKMQQAKS
jgi:hypothetical protein